MKNHLIPIILDVDSFPITINFDGDEPVFFDGGWAEAGGVVKNDQIALGSELIANGDFTNWTGDDPDGYTITENTPNTDISQVGSGQGHGGAGTGLANIWRNGAGSSGDPAMVQSVLVAQAWHEFNIDIDVANSGRVVLRDNDRFFGTFTTTGSKKVTGRSGAGANIDLRQTLDPTDITIDNYSVKQLTFTSIINALKAQFGLADGFFIDIAINAVTPNTQVGIVWNLDDPVTLANFGMAYMDGTDLLAVKMVAGVFTQLATVAQAVTSDQILRIENPTGSNVLDILYNGVSKATPTISDAGIIANRGMALFSTEGDNAISQVTIGKL